MIAAFLASRYAGPALIGAAVVCAALAAFGFTYSKGYGNGYAKKTAEVLAQEAVAERARDLDRIRRTERSGAIEQKVIEVREKVRTVYRTITKEIPVYVPSDACPMPSGFRLLHDAAAEGRAPEPPSSPDAAPVPAQDVARTVVENYEGCRDNADRLEGLQQWVREVTR